MEQSPDNRFQHNISYASLGYWRIGNPVGKLHTVYSLIRLVQERVQAEFVVVLEPEVRLKGDWPGPCQLLGIA